MVPATTLVPVSTRKKITPHMYSESISTDEGTAAERRGFPRVTAFSKEELGCEPRFWWLQSYTNKCCS